MIDLNKVLITGRLTADPVLKYIQTGTAICDMRLASGRSYQDRATGERREDTVFINVTAFGKNAEFCNEYLRKGSGVFVEGRLRHETWTDKEGGKRERISISADRVQFGETKAEATARSQRGEMGGPSDPGEPGGGRPEPRSAPRGPQGPPPPDETSDDLPF